MKPKNCMRKKENLLSSSKYCIHSLTSSTEFHLCTLQRVHSCSLKLQRGFQPSSLCRVSAPAVYPPVRTHTPKSVPTCQMPFERVSAPVVYPPPSPPFTRGESGLQVSLPPVGLVDSPPPR